MTFSSSARHRLSRVPRWLWILSILLLALRLFLPLAGQWVINRTLAKKLDHYSARIADFDLNLIRGACQLQGLTVKKKGGALPPFLTVAEIDLAISWRALLRGEISADVIVDRMNLNLIDSREDSSRQLGFDEGRRREKSEPKGARKGWRQVLNALVPMHIESLRIYDSKLSFTNRDIKEPVFVHLDQINLGAEDLRTGPRGKSRKLSPFWASAVLQNRAGIEVKGGLDVLTNPPRADLDGVLKNFQLSGLNKILMAYIPVDITKGRLSVFSEVAIANRKMKGYAKIFLADTDVIAPKQEFVSAQHLGFEVLTAIATWLLQNSKTHDVAAYIPFEKKNGKLDFNWFEALVSSLENKADELQPGLDHQISLKSLEANQKSIP